MPVQLWTYADTPLAFSDIADALDLRPERYHYVVATLAQERMRNTGPRGAVHPLEQGDAGDYQLVFHKMLRLWLETRYGGLLTRAEERIVVARNSSRAVGHLPEAERQAA